MTADEILTRWAASRTRFSEEEITSVTFSHECGWTNESGTSWPEETTAHVRAGKRKETIYCPSEPGDLLQEILNAGLQS